MNRLSCFRLASIRLALVGLVAFAGHPALASDSAPPPLVQAASPDSTPVIDIMDDLDATRQLLDETLQQLKEGHLDQSLISYQQAVSSFVDGSVAIRNHARQTGQALVKLDFALSHLEQMIQQVDPQLSQTWLSELSSRRTQYLEEVDQFAQRQQEASIASMKQALLAQQQAASNRLQMLDVWLQQAGKPTQDNKDVLKLALEGLCLQKNRLTSDIELLALAGNVLSQKIQVAQHEVDQQLCLMAVQLRLPRQLEQQLASTSSLVDQTLQSSHGSQSAARSTTRQIALEIVEPDEPITISNRSAAKVSATPPLDAKATTTKVATVPATVIVPYCPTAQVIRCR